ncbi:MAG: HAD family hydrolase [Bacteroidetes bacterium]|nr:MAG: HAD family hydrolase [Bacteroidota bacterium]
MRLKVLTIDFWNTLFDSSGGTERNNYRLAAFIKEADKYGIQFKADDFNEAIKKSWEYFNNIWKNDMRTPSPYESAEFFWKNLKLPYDKDSIKTLSEEFGNAILVNPPKLIEGVKDSLEILSKKFKLGIVSDTGFSPGTVLRKLLEKNSIISYFDAFSFSNETGVSKPHPIAFMTVLNNFGCNPEEALHIGDIEQTDIEGAKKLGMKAIRFKGDTSYPLTPEREEFTIADAEAESWSEIVELINNLSKKIIT